MSVIPAKAGIQIFIWDRWIPAFAGMTIGLALVESKVHLRSSARYRIPPECRQARGFWEAVRQTKLQKLLGGPIVACDFELDRRRWVLGGYQSLDDTYGVNGFGDRLHPGT